MSRLPPKAAKPISTAQYQANPNASVPAKNTRPKTIPTIVHFVAIAVPVLLPSCRWIADYAKSNSSTSLGALERTAI